MTLVLYPARVIFKKQLALGIVSLIMKIVVLSVGRVRQQFIKDGELEYLKRLKGGFQVELQELGLDAPESMSPQQVQEREGETLLKRIKPGEYIVALDERGRPATSKELSSLCSARMNAGTKMLWFVIGGAYGFSETVRQRADYVLSLSALTLPHQLARLVLVEQLYRAYTIQQGIGYHK